MKHNQSVEINHSTKTVTLTKKFLLAANRIGTPEFNEMMTLRTQFSDYTFEEREIKKNPNKQTYGNLTYAAMKDFIKGKETKERAEIILKELDTVIDLSQAQKASYVYVKKWFLNLYKEDFKTKQQLADEEYARIMGGDFSSILGNKNDESEAA